MKLIGLDIGTTSVSGVLIDTLSGEQIASRTIPNDTFLNTESWKHEQDAEKIIRICLGLLEEFKQLAPDAERIGLTGQMHGIVYTDGEGRLISSLATWEDDRGNLPFRDGYSYAGYLQAKSGYPMSTGFGLTTHFYNMHNGLVPDGAARLCTIMDYLAMVLCGKKEPCTHPSNAAGLGLFDLESGRFDEECVRSLGMDPGMLPEVTDGEQIIGRTADGLEVVVPIGDNQAGTYAVLTQPDDILLNIGTSSQISIACDEVTKREGLECRPYVKGKYLLLYAGLCGGVSFAMLNQFFRDVCKMFSVEVSKGEVFGRMSEEAEKVYGNEDPLSISTLFRGRRSMPDLKGSITGIDMKNFTPGQLTLGFYKGVIQELYEAYLAMDLPEGKGRLLLGGNALRSNALLRRICADMFGRQTVLLDQKEEAALGAARLAGTL